MTRSNARTWAPPMPRPSRQRCPAATLLPRSPPQQRRGDPMTAVLTCSGLDAGYVPGRPVLRNVDISLEKGTVLALLGPNGAGKTTLLLTIAGLQPPLAGHVGLGGNPVRPGSPRAAVKAGLVLVPDDRSLFKGLTVAENLRLASRRSGARRRA